jgi:mRNA-degrading endonuclease toxin of MazEF toxin-antitoxin module
MQNEPFLSRLPTVQIIPFTSQLAANRFPGTLVVQPDGMKGLTVTSVVLVFPISAQDKSNMLHRLGELDPTTLDQIHAIVQKLLL